MTSLKIILVTITLFSSISPTTNQEQHQPTPLVQRAQALKAEVPRVLCLNEKIATGGQPTNQAYGKLAANGFRSVLNLRTDSEGVDLEKERELVKQAGLHYISIPVESKAPQEEQVSEFIRVVKDQANHPMLIYCGSANRVGAFWMIYRVVEEGWSEEKALEEAERVGLRSGQMKEFAQGYVARHKAK